MLALSKLEYVLSKRRPDIIQDDKEIEDSLMLCMVRAIQELDNELQRTRYEVSTLKNRLDELVAEINIAV